MDAAPPWQNYRVMPARNNNDRTMSLPGRSKPRIPAWRSAASLAALALVLASGTGCAASSDANGSTVPATVPAPLPPESGAQPAPDPVLAAAKARVEAALGGAAAGGAKPATDRIRAALTDAGFTAGQTEVTAGRTPTGLDADAVEAAVKVGDDCIVGQLRPGSVAVSILPVLADGRCLVGTQV